MRHNLGTVACGDDTAERKKRVVEGQEEEEAQNAADQLFNIKRKAKQPPTSPFTPNGLSTTTPGMYNSGPCI